ncbi:Flp pilus assembly complex ATPase component TadA [Skermanella sp. TT6]|uniref:Flp pilus assembly complex ATPase component TadA n=1 Tax=Skermanella cutis TaxID=2775420 RepID=A0ABX7BBG8_9PROT|nr:ATPase, T2SS/T4P/T4SS family [Skermanella sp. TT6]QQP91731.1 Flp pilus assembly complex ATPase component TadA [Skermanella sp. TT6]
MMSLADSLIATSATGTPADAPQDAFAADLLGSGHLSPASLERARRAASESGIGLPTAVVNLGIVPETIVAEALGRALSLPLVEPHEWPAEAVGEASPRWMEQARILPLRVEEDHVAVASADPTDSGALQAAGLLFDLPVRVRVATQSDIRKAVAKLRDGAASDTHVTTVAGDDDLQRLKDLASEAPVVRFVNHMIVQAVESRASDLHLESHEGGPVQWLRIDGDLAQTEAPAPVLHRAVVSRIKILAGIDIAERRLPQDGRIKMTVGGRQVDLRVGIVPTLHGESVAIRVLDRSSVALDFGKLGFTGPVLDKWLEASNRPYGIVLVTGPTGSGKTTTLYSSLLRVFVPSRKYFTIEDPIEYQLPGVNQTEVKPGIKLTFASILRALLRQNPNVILVGEIRDRETAQTAIEASLTGHLIMSTLHTNDAPGAITRMLEMGVEDYLLASTLNAVLAQRLVRTLCPDCREPHPYADAIVQRFDLDRFVDGGRAQPMHAPGCPSCRGTGWRGRTMITELMVMTDRMRAAAMARGEAPRLAEIAREEGMETLFESGLRKVAEGSTTVEEVLRATLQGAS